MNLDDLDLFKQLDPDGMLGYIDALPDQFESAWAHAASLEVPDTQIDRVLICGMGGSAISGSLFAALAAESALVPIEVLRGYTLPAYARDASTLVIGMSHSGNTEETLSAISEALERGCTVLAITTGGKLSQVVSEAGGTVWQYDYPSPPRAALGWLYGMLLGAAAKLGLIPDFSDDVSESLTVMRKYQEIWGAEMMAARNPAKRYAGQLVDCIPIFWGAGLMAPVARRWKTQVNENSKSSAYYEELPELNHNTVVGIVAPDELMRNHKFQVIQLTSRYDHPRVALRHQLTHSMLLTEGFITDPIKARGESRLAQQMSMILFGDYLSYYLAMAYKVDPTIIEPIMMLKSMMAEAE